MKRKKICFILLIFIFFFSLSSCKKGDEKNGASAIFYLNGGTYQNNSQRIIYYYDHVVEGKETYIRNMDTDKITRPGYVLEGWYRTMNDDGTFEDKWDFEKDKMGHDGVDLYAKWVTDVKYCFELFYGDYSKSHIYELDNKYKNQVFTDGLQFANQYPGHTLLGFEDEEGREGANIIHPCEGDSRTIKVYAKYIEGRYNVVKTAEGLKAAIYDNIYLANDIDMQGEELNLGDYSKHFVGNGHTISNFKVSGNPKDVDTSDLQEDGTKGNLYISIFKRLNKATIEDVNFENVQYLAEKDSTRVQNVYIAPLVARADNATIKNVHVTGTVSITIQKTCTTVLDQLYFMMNNSTISEDCSVSVTMKNKD